MTAHQSLYSKWLVALVGAVDSARLLNSSLTPVSAPVSLTLERNGLYATNAAPVALTGAGATTLGLYSAGTLLCSIPWTGGAVGKHQLAVSFYGAAPALVH